MTSDLPDSEASSNVPEMDHDQPRDGRYDRLAQALRELGISQAALSNGTGIDASVISKAMTGSGSLERHWPTIALWLDEHYGVTLDWVFKGIGPMTQAHRTPAQALPALTGFTKPEYLREVGTVTELGGFSESMSRTKTVPGDSTALVQDSSMDPLIRAGQWVVLAPAERAPKDGEIVMVRCRDGSAFVRRYRPHNGSIVLENINQDRRYRAILVARDDVLSINVVVGVLFE